MIDKSFPHSYFENNDLNVEETECLRCAELMKASNSQ